MKKIIVFIFLLNLVFGFANLCFANNNYNELTTEQLYNLLENTDYVIIDVRSKLEYLCGCIKNAISTPQRRSDFSKIPKNKKIIFYCANIRCNDAKNSAKSAIAQGFENVYVYSGGYEEWLEKKMPITKIIDTSKIDKTEIISVKSGDLEKNKNDYIILDFLNDEKYGKIKDAIIIEFNNLDELKKKIKKLKKTKKKILAYHLTENLSKLSAEVLISTNLLPKKEIYYLESGLLAWLATGRKTEQ
ncbi:MAG TPA: rhodanese-like domain-containing protein [bacterium]|nr:rhodanese-like domain-containing protein [bacterium]HPP87977.1 rhodanese-like domain-containing protein [bacterium]